MEAWQKMLKTWVEATYAEVVILLLRINRLHNYL